jgi:hypothetical protein
MRTVRKDNLELEETALPDCLVLARHSTIPLLDIHHARGVAHGFGKEAKGMIASPLLPVFRVSKCFIFSGE